MVVLGFRVQDVGFRVGSLRLGSAQVYELRVIGSRSGLCGIRISAYRHKY